MTVYVEEKTLSDEDFHDQSELFIPMKSSLRVFKGYEVKMTLDVSFLLTRNFNSTEMFNTINTFSGLSKIDSID